MLRNLKREKYFTIVLLFLDVFLLLIYIALFLQSGISLYVLTIIIGISLIIFWITISSYMWIPLLTSEGIILLKKFAVHSKFKEFCKIKYLDVRTVIFSRKKIDNGMIMLVYSVGNIIKSVFFRIGKDVIDAEKFIQILSEQKVNILSISSPLDSIKVKEWTEMKSSAQHMERVESPNRRIG